MQSVVIVSFDLDAITSGKTLKEKRLTSSTEELRSDHYLNTKPFVRQFQKFHGKFSLFKVRMLLISYPSANDVARDVECI